MQLLNIATQKYLAQSIITVLMLLVAKPKANALPGEGAGQGGGGSSSHLSLACTSNSHLSLACTSNWRQKVCRQESKGSPVGVA